MRLTENELIEELRAMRPRPGTAFAAELDQRAGEGFPRGEPRTPFPGWLERLRAVPARRLVPAIGAVATVAVIGAVAVSELSSSGPADDGATSTPLGAEHGSAKNAGGDAATPTEGIAPTSPGTAIPDTAPVPPTDDLAPGAAKRQVERSASLTLSTEAGRVAGVADGVVEVTDRYGGFVVSSSVHTSGEGGSRASFELRVPAPRLQEALADLSGLAHVKARNEGSLDITAPVVSATEHLKDSKAEAEGLLEQLASASTPEESAALRDRLRAVRDELASARAELRSLSQRADLTAISVTVLGDGGSGGWGIGNAANDAASVLRTTAGIALVSLAVLVPLALLAGLLWLVSRSARRRARDRALD